MKFWQYTSLALAVIVFILLGLFSCEHGKVKRLQKDCDQKLIKADTVTVHDTIKEAFDIIVYVPQIKEIKTPVPVYVEGKEVIREVDTSAILKDYYTTVFYSDSQRVGGSTIRIDDQISQNRIKQRQVYGSIEREIVTNNITKTIEAKKKNILYAGIGGGWADSTLFPSASLLFVPKKGAAYQANVGLLNNKLFYQGQIFFPIRLNKK